jgi:hypothetical protein
MSLELELALDDTVQQPPTDAHKRALVERMAASTHFRRATRLRDFLLYVTRQEIRNPSAEVHEQEIGAKVFGRPAQYDTGQDNIVRVNATELRKRIDLYFSAEGADEELIITIPRGSYMPVFSWRTPEISRLLPVAALVNESGETETPAAAAARQAELATPAGAANGSAGSFWILSTVVLGVVCIGLLIALLNRPSAEIQSRPTVMAFWTDFLRKGQTDVVLPDESVSVMEDMLKRSVPLGEYLDRSYITGLASAPIDDERKQDVREVLNHNLITFGSVNAAQQILLLPGLGSRFHLTISRLYPADDIKRDNVVLIGGKKSNPWVSLFEPNMNFSVDYDNTHSQAFVTNHHPGPGEQPAYTVSMSRNALVGYSVVAFIPNPSKTGNVVILAGTDSDATAAAAEFITSEEQLAKLRTTLHVSRLPYFELLLKTSRLSGASLGSEVVAYRTYGNAN